MRVGHARHRLLCVALIAFGFALSGAACSRKPTRTQQTRVDEQEPATPVGAGASSSAPTPSLTTPPPPPQRRIQVSTKPPPAELWREFNGRNVLETAGKLVSLGPRPAGSAELESARRLLVSALENSAWEVERDPFETTVEDDTIAGVNLVARFSAEGFRPVPKTPRSILVVAPYDTREFSTIRFVGANDGASGPAVLVELARVLSLNPRWAEKVDLLLADASEPRQQFSPTDGLAGSRHYVLEADTSALRRVLVLAGVGANGETLTVSPETPSDIWQEATLGCARVGRPSLLRKLDRYVWGDHVPFAECGISSLYLGNHDYLARYTADDRIEKLSAATLEQVGQFATWIVGHWAQQ